MNKSDITFFALLILCALLVVGTVCQYIAFSADTSTTSVDISIPDYTFLSNEVKKQIQFSAVESENTTMADKPAVSDVFVDNFILLDLPIDETVQRTIFDLCKEQELDYAFVLALIQTESSFRANVISKTNDYGLMQINKNNHDKLFHILGIQDFLDPGENVRAGTFILAELFKKYDDPHQVLMAYNMGENGAKRKWNKGIYTSSFSVKVMERKTEFEELLKDKK